MSRQPGLVAALAWCGAIAFGQDAPPPKEQPPQQTDARAASSADRLDPTVAGAPATRVQEIEMQRQKKATSLSPDIPPKGEGVVKSVQHVADKIFGGWNGLHLVVGGMYPRSGFAFGPEYLLPDIAGGRVVFRTSARTSFKKYEKADMELAFPRLANDHAFVTLLGVYRNYPSVDYYGPGNNSAKTGRSNYRLEDTAADLTAGIRALRFVRLGVTGGYLAVNIGPGQDDRIASADRTYTEAQAPGIQHQSDYLRGGPFLEFDYRDRPGDPHSGGYYSGRFMYYDDEGLNIYNFWRFVGTVEQYVPFLNQKRVIVLRGKTELSYRNGETPIPFYLQPTLGGSEDLRGFRVFRYYGDNSLLLQGEYRWEVMTGLDMALFVDSGKVFQSKSNLNFSQMHTDAGFGLRFSNKSSVIMRWDVGFSREGFEVWIKFGNVF